MIGLSSEVVFGISLQLMLLLVRLTESFMEKQRTKRKLESEDMQGWVLFIRKRVFFKSSLSFNRAKEKPSLKYQT